MRYGMIIDLDRCIGCDACTMACKQANGTPKGTFWSKVERNETGVYPDAYTEYVPTLCMHCKNAACVDACPYGVSVYATDGTVQILSEMCVGCNYCVAACPYGARTFDFGEWKLYSPEKGKSAYEEIQEACQPYRNTVSKCTLCKDRRDKGDAPACVHTCPTDARTFGDLDSSGMQTLIQSRQAYQLKPEAGTDPSVYYLPRKLKSQRNY